MPKALVIRLGAIGDMIMMMPVLKQLKKDGYHVTVSVNKYSESVLKHCPYVDAHHHHDYDIPNDERLGMYWEEIGKRYDKVVNLSESIERKLLPCDYHPEYSLSHEERHALLNKNYYDTQLEMAGYPHIKGESGEMFFSNAEEMWCRDKLKKYRNNYKVMWSLSGSSFHKTYPFAQNVCEVFLSLHEDAVIFLTGHYVDKLLVWQHPRVKDLVDNWTLRQVLCSIKYMDLVVAPETGILNAAGCYDVPKIALLSHSSEENLTKYFKNCTNLHADVECYPCHRLIYGRAECPLDPITVGPICMSKLPAKRILDAMEYWYYHKEERCNSATSRRH